MPVRYTLAWFLLLVAALVNAFLREGVYKNALGELRAHQLSTFTALVLFGVIIWPLVLLWLMTAPFLFYKTKSFACER